MLNIQLKQAFRFLILFACFPVILHAAEPAQEGGSLGLTAAERQWLAEHPVIRVAPDPDYPPIESLDESRKLIGISADYLKLLEKKLGVRFQVVPVPSWDEAMRRAQSREVDMLSAATKTSDRAAYMSFTTPHIELPGVIMVRSDAEDYPDLEALTGKKVGVVSSYVWQEWIARDHPGIDLQPVRDMATGLLLVSFGELEAMVGNLATATHTLKNLGITNLRVAAETGYFARLALATRNDWPELNGILQKAVSSISPEENRAILDKWIALESAARHETRTILFAVLIVIALVCAVVGGICFGTTRLGNKSVGKPTLYAKAGRICATP
jgi:ABC-type amino acid transport substrate-binding protein